MLNIIRTFGKIFAKNNAATIAVCTGINVVLTIITERKNIVNVCTKFGKRVKTKTLKKVNTPKNFNEEQVDTVVDVEPED